ncbi:MAG: hypothetical protein H6Q89_2669 [Myxococcaceae bacterium]|nr:hypothetical protein [Myxococcaceae bacterium]
MSIDSLGAVFPEVRAPDWDGHERCVARRLLASNDAPWLAFSVQRGPFKAFVSSTQLTAAGVDLPALERSAVARLATSAPEQRRKMNLAREPGSEEVPVVLLEGERAAARIADPEALRALHQELGSDTLAVAIPSTSQLVATPAAIALRHPVLNLTTHLLERAAAEHRLSARLFLVQSGVVSGWIRTAADEAGPAQPDFVALRAAAYPDGNPGPRPAMDALWTATFQLKQWLFATTPGKPTEPYVSEHGGKQWAFAFTDSAHLERFLTQNGLRGSGDVIFLAMPVDGARRWLEQMGARGVFGVQFNFAGPGWFAPTQNLAAIHKHLMG